MKLLFDPQILQTTKSMDLLPLECQWCHKEFNMACKYIKSILKLNKNTKGNFCNRKCVALSKTTSILVNCGACNKQIDVHKNQHNKSKSGFSFCTSSCAAIYSNAHKTTGTRRSKLEAWLEQKLKELYPNLDIAYNYKVAIKSELDVHIPELNLAFELNGIFHYKPIYGEDKLLKTQTNDKKKIQYCLDNNIELTIIDVSDQKRFQEKTSYEYLKIIVDKIQNINL